MFLKKNGFRTFIGLAVLVGGGLWIAVSLIRHDGIGKFVAEADIFPGVKGSGHIVDEHRDLPDVDSIEMEGSYDATITIGSKPSLTITADDNIIPIITSDVEDGNLVITSKSSNAPSQRVKLAITVPSLHAVSMNSGTTSVAGVSGGDLKLTIEGSGKIEATGKLESLDAKVEGSGDLLLASLQSTNARIAIEGSGKVDVSASQTLDVQIDGSGTVIYHGQPAHVGRVINGSGKIEAAT